MSDQVTKSDGEEQAGLYCVTMTKEFRDAGIYMLRRKLRLFEIDDQQWVRGLIQFLELAEAGPTGKVLHDKVMELYYDEQTENKDPETLDMAWAFVTVCEKYFGVPSGVGTIVDVKR